ncbi:MAG TPA: hypothetical protein VGH47_10810 [Xanthobacteraceae bacterium]
MRLPRRNFILAVAACLMPRRWLARAESVAVAPAESVAAYSTAGSSLAYVYAHWDDIIEDAALAAVEEWKQEEQRAKMGEAE